MTHETRQRILETPFGRVILLWSGSRENPRISRVLLPDRKTPLRETVLAPSPVPRPEKCMDSCPAINAIATGIGAMMAGKAAAFLLDALDLGACSRFQRRVLLATCEIPWGRVSTYRLLAQYLSGKPGGARAVGNALAGNPFPLIIPCHRVIRSDGALGGYGGGWEMKYALLRGEGVFFDKAGRVRDARHAFP